MELVAFMKTIGSFGTVSIVEADGHDLADTRDGRAEARPVRQLGQARWIEGGQMGESRRLEGRAVVVGDLAREIAQRTLAIDQTGLLGAWRAVADELHGFSPAGNDGGRTESPFIEQARAIAKTRTLVAERGFAPAHRPGAGGRLSQRRWAVGSGNRWQ
jgi:hypothetical protein